MEKYLKLANYSLDLIDKGIMTENGRRDFDIIDFYDLAREFGIVGVDVYKIIKSVRDYLAPADYKKLLVFSSNNVGFSKNSVDNRMNPIINECCIKELLDEIVVFNAEVTNGYYVEGTGKLISAEEKLAVLERLYESQTEITYKGFRTGLKRIANNYSLENVFENKISNDLEIISKVIAGIENGVMMEDGNIRPFDIIDYFTLNNENLYSFIKRADKLIAPKEKRALYIFARKSLGEPMGKFSGKLMEATAQKNKESVINTKVVCNCEFDDNGKLIPYSGREITLEEKMEIISLLETFDYDFIPNLFNIAVHRIANNIPLYNDDKNMSKNI